MLVYGTFDTDAILVSPISLAPDQWTPCDIVGVVCMILCLAVLVEDHLVIDRQTEGQTDGHTATAIPRDRAGNGSPRATHDPSDPLSS